MLVSGAADEKRSPFGIVYLRGLLRKVLAERLMRRPPENSLLHIASRYCYYSV